MFTGLTYEKQGDFNAKLYPHDKATTPFFGYASDHDKNIHGKQVFFILIVYHDQLLTIHKNPV